MRVYELAKELDLPTKEVLSRLEDLGRGVSSHQSSVDDETAERIRASVTPPGELPTPAPAAGNSETAAGRPSAETLPDHPSPQTIRPQRPVPPPPEASPLIKKPGRSTFSASPRRRRVFSQLTELPMLVVFAFIIAIVIKTFLVQAFFIPSGSMKPTLRVGDRVLVEKLGYLVDQPSQGDIVVFARSVFGNQPDLPWYDDVKNYFRELLGLPTGKEEDYIKRIVAGSGDTVRYGGSPRHLWVNGEVVKEPYLKQADRSSPTLDSKDCKGLHMPVADRGCRVPAGDVFVMGDNRGNSEDSRVIGPIPEDKIVGRAFVVIWPPADFGGL
jgi:signal peptidase I